MMGTKNQILGYKKQISDDYYIKIHNLCQQLPKYCTDYAIYLKEKQPGTILGYLRDVNIFLHFLVFERRLRKSIAKVTILDLSQIRSNTINEFLTWLDRYEIDGVIHKNSEKGKKRKLYSIKTFYKFLKSIRDDIVDPTIDCGYSKNPAPSSRVLTTHELNKFFRYLDDSYSYNNDKLFHIVNDESLLAGKRVSLKPAIVLRDRAILHLIASTGLRVSEIVSLNISDIYKDRIIIRRLNNGLKEMPVSEEISFYLHYYIEEGRPALSPKDDHSEALFISTKHSRMTPRAIQMMIKDYATRVFGPDHNITPHSLRASYGSNVFLNNDASAALELMDQKAVKSFKHYYSNLMS